MIRKSMDFSASFEKLGMWWLAENDANKVPGLLRVSSETVRLEVVGSILSNPDNPSSEDNLLIYGILKGGELVTLISAYRQGSSYNSSSIEEEYESQDVVFGDHINPDLGFQKMVMEISNLGDWLNLDTMRMDRVLEGDKYKSIDIHHEIPEEISLELPSIAAVGRLHAVTAYRHDNTQANLEVVPKISIEFQTSQDLNYCAKIKYRIQCLWTFFVGHPVDIQKCVLSSGKSKVHWRFPKFRWFKPKESLHYRRMVAPYPILKNELNKIVDRWFAKWSNLEPAIILFFSSFFRPDLFVQTHFLNMAQASEALHRATFQEIPDSVRGAFDIARKKVREAVRDEPKDVRKRINESIAFADEPTFANRIQELAEKLEPGTIQKYVGNVGEFKRRVKDLRNYLTHYPGALKGKVEENLNTISLLTEQLKYVFYHHLCLQFVDSEEVPKILINKFHYLERWKRRVFPE